MTIDEHICSGGIAVVPDLRGGVECYSDDYATLVITQTPAPGQFVSAGQTVINVVTEDKSGNATICTHYLNVTADNPAPTLECPDPIVTWLLPGGYEVPDLTKEVEVIGGCTVYDDLVITQSPEAGTKITTAGVHTVTITVTDEYGHTVVCGSTTITLKTPNPVVVVVDPPDPPIVIPPYIFTQNLMAYWPFDDYGFLVDRSVYTLGGVGAGRDFTNGGNALQEPAQTILDGACHPASPGPIFGSGSAYFNRSNSAFLTRADDAGLRLTGTSWTIRFGFKLVSLDQFGPEVNVVWKRATSGIFAGYKFSITRLGGSNNWMRLVLTNSVGTNLDTGYVAIPGSTYVLIAGTFDTSTGTLKIYIDGVQQSTVTSAGYILSGDAQPFRVGDPSSGSTTEFYVDELGMWTEAWAPSRVLQDYQIVKCLN